MKSIGKEQIHLEKIKILKETGRKNQKGKDLESVDELCKEQDHSQLYDTRYKYGKSHQFYNMLKYI